MHLRPLLFRPILILPYPFTTTTTTSFLMSHVEMNRCNDTSGCKQGAQVSIKPGQRRLASVGINAVRRHLGGNALATARNKTGCSISATNNPASAIDVDVSASEITVACSNQPEHPSVVDVQQENKCSLPSVSSDSSGLDEEPQKENEFSNDIDGTQMLKEFSLPNRYGKHETPKSRRLKLIKENEYSNHVDCTQMLEEYSSPNGFEKHETPKSSRPKLIKHNEFAHDVDCTQMLEEYSLPNKFGKHETPLSRRPNLVKDGDRNRNKHPKNKNHAPVEVFDICRSEADDYMFPEPPIDFVDEAKVPEVDQLSNEPRQRVLRPGMVLLKSYLSDSEQVSIVRKCRELGIGPGGFYQPGYKFGAKLRLQMMCLGLDWDPWTRKYKKRRRIDRSKPPDIPPEFHGLVDRAMLDSLDLIRRDSKVSDAEDILPQMNSDVCIVNFYSETGRLGLHQDRDESTESLRKGLPVVSFSIGDSAEFLYGDQRDAKKAESLILESGDVLIFGGQSRHIFHGVASIIPNSAPRFLSEQTRLIPGRLNLTFRQY